MFLLNFLKKSRSPKEFEKVVAKAGMLSTYLAVILIVIAATIALVSSVFYIGTDTKASENSPEIIVMFIGLATLFFSAYFDHIDISNMPDVFSIKKGTVITRNNKVVRIYLEDVSEKWKKDVNSDEWNDYKEGVKIEKFFREMTLVKHFILTEDYARPNLSASIIFHTIEDVEGAQRFCDFFLFCKLREEAMKNLIDTIITPAFNRSIIDEIYTMLDSPKKESDSVYDKETTKLINEKLRRIGIKAKHINWTKFNPDLVSKL